jgi:hypothetical protein
MPKLPKTHTRGGAKSVSKIGCLGDCLPSAQWHKGGENSLGGRLFWITPLYYPLHGRHLVQPWQNLPSRATTPKV